MSQSKYVLLTDDRRVTKRRQSLHLDAVSYLIELLFFSNENLRGVMLSQVEVRMIRCVRQFGGRLSMSASGRKQK